MVAGRGSDPRDRPCRVSKDGQYSSPSDDLIALDTNGRPLVAEDFRDRFRESSGEYITRSQYERWLSERCRCSGANYNRDR